MSRLQIVSLAVGVVLAGCAASIAGDAPSYVGFKRGGDGYVVAESRYGHGKISGPVRYGPRDLLQVQAPGGTWYDCGRSCGDTLRRQTIDFWENYGGGRGANGEDGPGYFIWRR